MVRNETCATYLREEIRRVMCASKPERPSRSKYKSDYAYKLALGKYNTDSLYWADDPLYGWIEKNPRPDGEKYDLFTDGSTNLPVFCCTSTMQFLITIAL